MTALSPARRRSPATSPSTTEPTPIRTFQDHIHRAGRLETVGQLAGAVAHDFNNLLGAIIGLADLVTQEPPTRPR